MNFPSEFAVIIRDLVGGKSKIQTMAAVEDDPQRRKPDITRAKKYIHWEPRVNFLTNSQHHFMDLTCVVKC